MFRGEVLRQAREQAGYTLKGLSEALKEEYGGLVVDYTTLSQWEINPFAAPRKGNIKKVAEFLGIPLSDLYSDEEVAKLEEQLEILDLIQRIIDIYKLNPDDKRIEKIRLLLE